MFRYRPPVFALACLAAWLLLMLLLPLAFGWWGTEVSSTRYGQWVALGASVLLGALLLVQMPRALRWKPRRKARPSPELQAERQRIAQTLHDSVGAQLVQAMALLDAAQPMQRHALQGLEQCLLELRVVVDSMDWNVHQTGSGAQLDGAAAHHLALVVQEALSNMLQHARATRVAVSWAPVPSGRAWLLLVSDDGCGLAGSTGEVARARGKGLANMRQRAAQAGGRLQVTQSAQGGVCIGVEMPSAALPVAAPAPQSVAPAHRPSSH